MLYVCVDDEILRSSSLTIPRAREVAMATDPDVRRWLEENGVELVTYDDL